MTSGKRYKILTGMHTQRGGRIANLIDQVNRYIEDGWIPLGGVSWNDDIPYQAIELRPTITISGDFAGPGHSIPEYD